MPPDDNTPDFDKMSPEEIMAWMESLAKRQGASSEGFTTSADMVIAEIDPDSVVIDEPGYVPSEGKMKGKKIESIMPSKVAKPAAPAPAAPARGRQAIDQQIAGIHANDRLAKRDRETGQISDIARGRRFAEDQGRRDVRAHRHGHDTRRGGLAEVVPGHGGEGGAAHRGIAPDQAVGAGGIRTEQSSALVKLHIGDRSRERRRAGCNDDVGAGREDLIVDRVGDADHAAQDAGDADEEIVDLIGRVGRAGPIIIGKEEIENGAIIPSHGQSYISV